MLLTANRVAAKRLGGEAEPGCDQKDGLRRWRRHSLYVPLRRRPRGPAGGQFSSEDRPDDPPLSEDDLLRQATGDTSADAREGGATGEAASEASEDEDEIRLLKDHFRGRST